MSREAIARALSELLADVDDVMFARAVDAVADVVGVAD
jgi:hypothetical protein